MTTELTKPCAQCPWRLSNHGKRHFGSFYSKKNLTRLWGQVRRGGGEQSCHLTDPTHPDHILAGAKPNAKPSECPGSIIVVTRELKKLEKLGGGEVNMDAMKKYAAERKMGLTKTGLQYWLLTRIQFANVPMVGGPSIPSIPDDPEIGLPEDLLR